MTKASALASDNLLFPLAANWTSLSDRSCEVYENGRRPKAAATPETMQEANITLVYDNRSFFVRLRVGPMFSSGESALPCRSVPVLLSAEGLLDPRILVH